MQNQLPKIKKGFLLVLIPLLLVLIIPSIARAANLNIGMIRFNRMAVSTNNTTILVVVRAGAAATSNKIRVALNSTNYTVNSGVSSITTSTTGVTAETLTNTSVCTAAMPLTGSLSSAVTGTTVDFAITSTTLSTSVTHCFYITNGIGTSATNGTDIENRLETMNTSTVNDTSRVATAVVAAGGDQVTVSAVVPAIFSFSLSGTSTAFTADLSSSAVRSTSGITVTVSTNANSGWEAWLKSNAALTSAITAGTIATTGSFDGSTSSLSAGTSAYVVDVVQGTNTPAIDNEYNGTAPSNNKGGTISSNALQRIAYSTAPASGDTVAVYGIAGVSGTQKAATDYTDTWTIVGAGQF